MTGVGKLLCECVWMSLYMNLCITKNECESMSDCGCVIHL